MRLRTIVAAICLLVSVVTNAQWFSSSTGAALPDTKSQKSVGVLGVALRLTGDAEPFIQEWTDTPESHGLKLPPKGLIKRGSIVSALVFYSWCGDEQTPCRATVDFKVLAPDGSVYGEIPKGRVLRQGASKKGLVYLSQAYLRVRIEPKDPLGTYKVIATYRASENADPIELEEQFDVSP